MDLQRLSSLLVTLRLELGRERDGTSCALPLFLPSFPLETKCCKLNASKFIISFLSPANLELVASGARRIAEAREI